MTQPVLRNEPQRWNAEQLAEVESLTAKDVLSIEELTRLRELTGVTSALPTPDYHENGRAMFRKETIQEWGKASVHTRSTVAAPLTSEQEFFHRLHLENLNTRGRVRPKTYDPETMTFQAVIASDGRCLVYDYDTGRFVEEILVATGGEVPPVFPMLDTHKKSATSDVLGSAYSPFREGGFWIATHRLSDTVAGREIGKKIDDGDIDAMSIGYTILDAEPLIEPGRSRNVGGVLYTASQDLPLKITTKWRVREVSICPFGADPNAKIRSAQGIDMSRSAPAIHSRNSQTRVYLPGELTSAMMIFGGVDDPSRCRSMMTPQGIERLPQSPATIRDAEVGLELSKGGLVNVIVAAARAGGLQLSSEEIRSGMFWGKIYEGFPAGQCRAIYDLFSSAAMNLVAAGFDAVANPIEGWVGESENPMIGVPFDNVRLAGSELELRARGGTAVELDLSTEVEQGIVQPYAGKVTIFEEDFEDSTASGLLTALRESLGAAARYREISLALGALVANPEMSDGTELFHADHANVTTGPMDEATLVTATSLLAKQTENGLHLNQPTGFIITPTVLERPASKLVVSVFTDGKATPNPVVRSDSRLDAAAPGTWYVASGRKGHGIELQFLPGRRDPLVRTSFLTQGQFGVVIDVAHYVGVLVAGYRGLVRVQAS